MSRISTISEIRELDDGHAVVSPRRSNSLAAAAACEKRESPVTSPRSGARKLFDLVHLAHHAQRASAGGNSGGKAKWRSLRNRFRRAGAAWLAASSASEVAVSPGRRSNPPINPGSVPRSVSVRNPWPISDPELVSNRSSSVRRPLSVSLSVSVRNSEPPAPEPPVSLSVSVRNSEPPAPEPPVSLSVSVRNSEPPAPEPPSAPAPEKVAIENIPKPMPDDDDEEEEHSGSSAAAPTMSLMALLEQTDEWGGSGKEEEEEEEEVGTDEESEGGDDGMLYVCCVCMVQHKGARFTSCGHTFCRLCSRELWVTNSECPLCNGYILEILEIF